MLNGGRGFLVKCRTEGLEIVLAHTQTKESCRRGNFRIELPGRLQPLQSMVHVNFVTHNKELATTTTTATRMSQIYILNVQSNSSARFV